MKSTPAIRGVLCEKAGFLVLLERVVFCCHSGRFARLVALARSQVATIAIDMNDIAGDLESAALPKCIDRVHSAALAAGQAVFR